MSRRPWIWILAGAAAVLGLWLLVWSLGWLNKAAGRATTGYFARTGQRRLSVVRSEMHVGLSRQEVYARLRARNLDVFSVDFPATRDPKTRTSQAGTVLEYPPATFIAVGMNGKTYTVIHSSVWVPIGVGMRALGCGTEVDLTIKFDDRDVVRKLDYSAPQEECM